MSIGQGERHCGDRDDQQRFPHGFDSGLPTGHRSALQAPFPSVRAPVFWSRMQKPIACQYPKARRDGWSLDGLSMRR
jgi:hypothetical protein